MKAIVVVGVTLEHLGVELNDREKELLKPAVEAIARGILWVFVMTLMVRVTCFGSGEMSEGET